MRVARKRLEAVAGDEEFVGQAVDLASQFVEAGVHLRFESVEPPVHTIQPGGGDAELLVDAVEPGVDAFEAAVDAREVIVDSLEALVDETELVENLALEFPEDFSLELLESGKGQGLVRHAGHRLAPRSSASIRP